MDKILLIDGNNNIYRSCITFGSIQKPLAPPRVDNWGFENQPVDPLPEEFASIFAFFRNLRALIAQFAPGKVFFALEGHPQFRYDIYPGYKANRIVKTAAPSAAKILFDKASPEILRLLKHLPVSLVRATDYEADDTIATLSENMREEEIIIASGDKDFIQLLQKGYNNLTVYNPTTKANREAPSYNFIAYRSICGDKSDDIKGIAGYGPKKTEKLLSDPEKFQQFLSVEENRANFNINRQLIEFREVPLEEIILEEGMTNFDFLKEEFSRMQFKTMLQEPYWTTFQDTFNNITL
jgi:DNA polymerase I